MKYKHSNDFYKKQWKKYKEEISGTRSLFTNYKDFRRMYKYYESTGYKDIRKNFVYDTLYSIDFSTYKAERDIMKKIGKRVKKKELLGMTTREFAEKYSHEIDVVYNSYMKQGKTSTEAKELIALYFFGSN